MKLDAVWQLRTIHLLTAPDISTCYGHYLVLLFSRPARYLLCLVTNCQIWHPQVNKRVTTPTTIDIVSMGDTES